MAAIDAVPAQERIEVEFDENTQEIRITQFRVGGEDVSVFVSRAHAKSLCDAVMELAINS